jgi:ribosome-binding protein aMBF1 (putative translation factor)
MSVEKSWSSVRRKLARHPAFCQAYEDERPEFERARTIIEARLRNNLSQAELAGRIGTQQPSIARLEDPDYQGGSLAMLKKIARVTHSRLVVRLEPQPTATKP